MFSGQSFGQFSFGEQDYTPPDASAFEAFLAEVVSERCWLLEIDALSLASVSTLSASFSDAAFGEVAFDDAEAGVTGGVSTLCFSTHGYTTHAADSPASTWYDGRLTDQILIDRRITGRDGLGGIATVYAETTLINADGALDSLLDNYALDGRRARILLGRASDALSEFGVAFSGVVERTPIVGLTEMRFRLSDGSAKLLRAVNETTYAGTGGVEGGADLAGKPKPKGWGHVFGISPPLVDATNLIYQVHDGAISDVPQVYDRGVLLTKVAGAPAAGQYQVTAASGTFKLGATPSGAVTCNALCDASLSGYINRASDIALRILVQQAGLTSSEIEPSSFVQLNTDTPAEVGVWVGTDSRSVADVVGELLAGVGAFGGFARHGGFSVGMVAAPAGTPRATFTELDIVDIARESLPPAVEPIVWRASVGYQRNYTVQQDLAAAVPAAQRAFAAEARRVVTAEDAAIPSRRLLAREYANDAALYALEADAVAEAQRLFALWSATRSVFRVKTRPRALVRDLGQVIQLEHRRHGLSGGRPARVIGHTVRASEIELLALV